MSQEANEMMQDVQKIMTEALFQMPKIVNKEITTQENFLPLVNLFLLSIVSTAADLTETIVPGSSAYLYADVEAGAKLGGLRAIQEMATEHGRIQYSVSNIDPDNIEAAMNYLGQQLSIALYKGFYELPKPLRTVELQLRCLEALMTNLLNQKLDNPHEILDSFCEHVHMALNGLKHPTSH